MIEHRVQVRDKSLRGQLLLVVAFLTCPCHLIIAVPLLAAGGSAFGLFLEGHFTLVLIIFSGTFITSLVLGMKFLGKGELFSKARGDTALSINNHKGGSLVVEKESQKKESYYKCQICEMAYKEKEWADKCQAWCSEHNGSCNLDIIQHAVNDQDKGCC